MKKPPTDLPASKDDWMTPKELAAYLKISLPTIRRYVESKGIPFMRIGNRVRFNPPKVVEALIDATNKKEK